MHHITSHCIQLASCEPASFWRDDDGTWPSDAYMHVLASSLPATATAAVYTVAYLAFVEITVRACKSLLCMASLCRQVVQLLTGVAEATPKMLRSSAQRRARAIRTRAPPRPCLTLADVDG